jgi:hypothetical protein
MIKLGLASLLAGTIGWFCYQYYTKRGVTKMVMGISPSETRSLKELRSHREPKSNNEPQTTRVYFDSLSGINDASLFITDHSEIDDINLDPSDNHNVHNISIINSIKNKLPLLYRGEQSKFSFVSVIQQIRELLRERQVSYPNVTKVIRFIVESRASYSSRLIKEYEIIRLIWARIHHPSNHSNLELLQNEFLSQLNDCYQSEEQSVCCLEGRIVRYFQVLELYDFESNEWTLVPLWLYKNEIENYCAKSLNEMVQKLTLEDQLIYFKENPTSEEQERVNKWNQELVDCLEQQFEKEYGDKLEKEQLRGLTMPCFQAIVG